MNSIKSLRTAKLLQSGKKFLVGYILAGYPDNDSFFDVLEVINESKFDILEIGFPSSDPYSDGKIIADAHKAVDKQVCCSLLYWEKIRQNTTKPIWIMGYKHDLLNKDLYLQLARQNLVDGIVIPDITNEDRVHLQEKIGNTNIDIIGFSNPEMSKEELEYVFSNFSLMYEQLYVGQTGIPNEEEEYHEMLSRSLKNKDVYGFAGFGISTPEKVDTLFKEGFHGAIIGTAIVKHINISLDSLKAYLQSLGETKQAWQ